MPDVGEGGADVGSNHNFLAAHRMAYAHFNAGEQQAVAAEMLLKKSIVATLAVGGIADDGVVDVLHVPT